MLDSNTLVFYVASESGSGVAVQSPITGEITAKGRKLRIRIPQELRQPVPGVDASLTSLDQTFTAKRGKNYLVKSIGCKKRKHKFTGKLDVHPARRRRSGAGARSTSRRAPPARSSALTQHASLYTTAPPRRGRRRS